MYLKKKKKKLEQKKPVPSLTCVNLIVPFLTLDLFIEKFQNTEHWKVQKPEPRQPYSNKSITI